MPEWLTPNVTLTIVAAIAAAMLLTPAFLLRYPQRIRISAFGLRPFAPNWLTAYGTFGTTALFFALFERFPRLAIILVAFTGFLDHWDGKAARSTKQVLGPRDHWTQMDGRIAAPVYHAETGSLIGKAHCKDTPRDKFWLEMNFDGGTALGKVFDPFGDKVRMLAITFYFAWIGILNPWLASIILAADTVGTLMRWPFNLFASLRSARQGASWIGKWKTILLWATLGAATFTTLGWFGFQKGAFWVDTLNTLLLASVAFLAILSPLSRLKKPKS